ncbi:YkgJ family cysteine cluster protein [Chloroflexota bacterium]
MTDKPRKRPRCSMCAKCCRAPVILITKPGDYKRWIRQGRTDILSYASEPPYHGYGDLWINIDGSEASGYCPFIRKVSHDDKYTCTIQDTKPKVCKEFRCEWAYGVGKKGIPFKTERGWTDRARQLGYGQTNNRSRSKDVNH